MNSEAIIIMKLFVVRETISLQVWTRPSDERHKNTTTSRGVAVGAVTAVAFDENN